MKQKRLDAWLVDLGHAACIDEARQWVRAGYVRLNERIFVTPSDLLTPLQAEALQLNLPQPFVGRGGEKLQEALQGFGLDPTGWLCVDVGASTGGFTDCLLQHGAARVIAIDVGHGQLDWRLRQDERVLCWEKTNIKTLSPQGFQARLQESKNFSSTVSTQPQLAVVDVSFTSITKVLPFVKALLPESTPILALVKPQFEYRHYFPDTPFDGVVREPTEREAILHGVEQALLGQGLLLKAQRPSPIAGAKGNLEQWFWLAGAAP